LPGDASGSGEERRGGGEVLCSAGVAAPVRLGAAAREPFAFTGAALGVVECATDEDEIDDLIFEDEETAPKEGIKWMALARVHTSNYFSPQTFEQHMRTAWSPAKEVTFKALEPNLFTIQCHCLGDWLKVEQGGPWLFRQNAVIIEPYDGLSAPESIDLNYVPVYIQIQKIPVGYRDKTLITNLVQKKVGKVMSVETVVEGVNNFVRVCVKLDVRKVLARFVTIVRAGQREFYHIKFEKIPRFCGVCGFLGHSHLECGTGEHDEASMKWGDWLKAGWETWHGRTQRGGRSGIRGGRGRFSAAEGRGRNMGGRGNVPNTSWRYNALAYNKDGTAIPEDPLADTGTSPRKTIPMDTEDRISTDSGTKRRLMLENNTDGEFQEDQLQEQGEGADLPMNTEDNLDLLENVDGGKLN
jgi:hypothetical protein